MSALIDFIEMDDRLAFEQHAFALSAVYGRPITVVEHAFEEAARGRQVFQALLVLDADEIAAEVIGDADRSDVHFALTENLFIGEIGSMPRTGVKLHTLLVKPRTYLRRFTSSGRNDSV
jgi:hypothetical protein